MVELAFRNLEQSYVWPTGCIPVKRSSSLRLCYMMIIHCGLPVVNDERLANPLDTGKKCAAPAGHLGAHADGYWEWIYEARKQVINEWETMLARRRVPRPLTERLSELVRAHYLEPKEEPKQAPSSNSQFDFYAEAVRQSPGTPWQSYNYNEEVIKETLRKKKEFLDAAMINNFMNHKT